MDAAGGPYRLENVGPAAEFHEHGRSLCPTVRAVTVRLPFLVAAGCLFAVAAGCSSDDSGSDDGAGPPPTTAAPEAAPVEDFTGSVEAFYDGMKDRPETTFGTMNDDVLAHFDADFKLAALAVSLQVFRQANVAL